MKTRSDIVYENEWTLSFQFNFTCNTEPTDLRLRLNLSFVKDIYVDIAKNWLKIVKKWPFIIS